MKVVHVKWVDPCFASSGWMGQREFEQWVNKGIVPSDSVGLLAHDGKDFIVLIQSVSTQQVADAIKITRSAIVEIIELGTVPIELSFLRLDLEVT